MGVTLKQGNKMWVYNIPLDSAEVAEKWEGSDRGVASEEGSSVEKR